MFSLALGILLSAKAAAPSPAIAFDVVGTWRGTTSSGATIEEQWQERIGDSMLGSFRMVGADGKIVFYEILTYDVATSILRIRHFDAGLNAKEEKDAPMAFQATAPGVFKRIDSGAKDESITYQRSDEKLTITVKKPGKDPAVFDFTSKTVRVKER